MTTLAELIVQETKAVLYQKALDIAVTVGLPVTSWQPGDPTRSLYHYLSTVLATLEQVGARYVASGFLDLAAALDDKTWLKLTAYQKYGYTAREATYATCTVRFTNGGGGVYTIDAQSVTFAKISDPDITYRNTSGGTLLVGPGTTLDVDAECEVAGSDGSASISDLELVTVLGAGTVTATNTTAAVGVDEESTTSIVQGCRNKLESLSPNGAAGAYAYVALDSTLTTAANVTRVRVVDSSTTGDVAVYLASSSGGASGTDVALVNTAIQEYATPLCITATVAAATEVPVVVTYTAKAYNTIGMTTGDIETAIAAALGVLFSGFPIGGDGAGGEIHRARIIHAIVNTYPGFIFDVTLTAPAADTVLTASQVATLSTITSTVTLEAAP